MFAPETAHLCSRLSREIIRAHEVFISQHPSARAAGYFATSSIVECIYHLAPVLQYSQDSQEHAACVSAFHQAHSILVRLSPYNSVADKALKALNGLIKKWSKASTSTGDRGAGASAMAPNDNVGRPVPLPTNSQNKTNDSQLAFTPGQFFSSNASNGQFGADTMNLDFGEWMDMSLGPLFSNDFINDIDFRMGA